MPCPPKFNPADHYIQIVSIVPGKEELCKDSVQRICDAFENSSLAISMRQQVSCRVSTCISEAIIIPNIIFATNNQYKKDFEGF